MISDNLSDNLSGNLSEKISSNLSEKISGNLSEKIFNYGIDLLEQNYDRKLPSPIKLIWREYLSEYLIDAEFVDAVKYVILHSRFMPTPSELVEHIHGSKEVQAIQEWQLALQISRDGGTEVYLSERGKIALKAIGGLHQLGLADEYTRQHKEKSFIKVFCQCSVKDTRMLPQSSTSATREDRPSESSPMPEEVRAKFEALKAKMTMNGKG